MFGINAEMVYRIRAEQAFGRNGISFSGFRYDFNAAGQIANLPTQLGGTGGRFGFGTLNTLRAQQPTYSSDRRKAVVLIG